MPAPALIGLDWGTSTLRGHLLAADGSVLETVSRPWGIQHLPAGGFAAALEGVAGPWRSRAASLPVVAAGMVGSRQGWREVPYVSCPADAATIAAGVVAFPSEAGLLHLVPGLSQARPLPNVLRGEETQIIGAIAHAPALAEGAVFVLPGTHAKWVDVREGRITRFDTFLTGELFALLRDHSLLGRPAREAVATSGAAEPSPVAFSRGLAEARDSGAAGVASRLFAARSLFLTGDLAPAATLDYLSGLLIGEEVRSALASRGGRPPSPLVLVGDESLCARYRQACEAFDLPSPAWVGDGAAAGLWEIARRAGLVTTSSTGPDRSSAGR